MSLLKAFFSIGLLTLLSRVLGLLRDVVIAAVFGAGGGSDAFFAAFRLPNMLRRFTAEGALTQAFLPAYGAARRRSDKAAATLGGETAGALCVFLFIVSVACVIGAPFIMKIIAPGLRDSELAAMLLRIVFPYILFISVVALFSAILNAHGKFKLPALSPVILNLSMIGGAVWAAPYFSSPLVALAWSVFVAGVLQLMFLFYGVWRIGALPVLVLRLTPSAAARTMMLKMLQSALGAGAAQINLLINLAVASLLAVGSISWLYFADRIMELPAGLLGASLATVSLSALSHGEKSAQQFNAIIERTLRLCLLFSLPAAAGMAILAKPIITVLFLRGAFDGDDVQMTAAAVLAYSAGVVGLVATRPLATAFFAKQDAVTPMKTAVVCLLFTQLLNAVFILGAGWGHAGIALSIGLAANLNAFLLWRQLQSRGWYCPSPGGLKFVAKIIMALLIMSLFLFAAPSLSEAGGGAQKAMLLAAEIIVAAGVYFLVLFFAGVRPAHFQQNIMSDKVK